MSLVTSDPVVAGPRQTGLVVARWTLWFATAYTIVIVVHEAAHALAARAVGLHATLFHFWADIDRDNVLWQRATFGSAGPVSSLVLGAGAWLAYTRAQRPSIGVPLLFLATCGVSNFFGNLMSTAFIGDFSNVAVWLGLPTAVRYAISASGAIAIAYVLFVAGRELRRWMPPHWSRVAAVVLGVVVPVSLGTVLIVLVNQPVAIPGFVAARAGEAVVWLFAATGAAVTRPSAGDRVADRKLLLADVVFALVVVAIVRLLVEGVPLPT
jgi:hypothetical protein